MVIKRVNSRFVRNDRMKPVIWK